MVLMMVLMMVRSADVDIGVAFDVGIGLDAGVGVGGVVAGVVGEPDLLMVLIYS